jgi:hypothetical protein
MYPSSTTSERPRAALRVTLRGAGWRARSTAITARRRPPSVCPLALRSRAIWARLLPAARSARVRSTISEGTAAGRPSGDPGALALARRTSAFVDESLEFVGRDQERAPRHLDGLDVGEDAAVERGAADAECLGGLVPVRPARVSHLDSRLDEGCACRAVDGRASRRLLRGRGERGACDSRVVGGRFGRLEPAESVARRGNSVCNPYATRPCTAMHGNAVTLEQRVRPNFLQTGRFVEITERAVMPGFWIAPRRSAVRARLAPLSRSLHEPLHDCCPHHQEWWPSNSRI